MSKTLKVKTIQFAVGVDLLGSKMTLTSSKNNELEEVSTGVPGVIAYSKSSNRYIKIPGPNLKAIEYYPPSPEEKKEKPLK